MQQSWPKAAGADLGSIDNVPGWLTTLVARVCLDMVRQRRFHVPLDESGRVDTILLPAGVRTEVRGAGEVVEFDGAPVIVLTARGRVRIRIRLTFGVGGSTEIDIRAVR